jgi:hypothetical protein
MLPAVNALEFEELFHNTILVVKKHHCSLWLSNPSRTHPDCILKGLGTTKLTQLSLCVKWVLMGNRLWVFALAGLTRNAVL